MKLPSKTSRLFALGTLGTLLAPGPVLYAQQQVLTAQDADIRAFIADVARQTGRTVIVDPRVKGSVTVFSDRALNDSEMFEIFLATLRANGLVAVPGPSGSLVVTLEEGLSQLPGTAGVATRYVTEVFRFSNQDSATVIETLRPFLSRQGQIIANSRSNTVVVADYADNLKRLRGIVAQIDRDQSEVKTVALVNSQAREIAEAVRQIFGSGGAGDNAAGPRGGAISIVPVESSNTIILRGEPDAVRRYAEMIADLDDRAESSSDIRVIRLQHADAEQLLPVLQELIGQASPFTAPASGSAARQSGRNAIPPGGAGAPVAVPTGGGEGGSISGALGHTRIARYADANALVISADAETQKTLADVIRQLDVRRSQVLVEAIVVEVSDSVARQLGVQFLVGGNGSNGVPFASSNFSNNAPNILALTGALLNSDQLDSDTVNQLRATAISSLLGPVGALAGFGGQINSNAIFGVIINAVKNDTASNILSTPSILALDNEEATFLVGQEVPVSTGEALGADNTNPFRTIERRDVGVQLAVRPQINAGGAITLRIRQEVSTVAGVADPAIPELVFNTRELETTILADDGDIVVLGGLLSESQTRTRERVPILGDIPYVGNLFRNNIKSRDQTNLMVFLRPRIIRSREDAQKVTAPRYRTIRDAQVSRGDTGVSPIEEVVRDYLGTTPPGDEGPVRRVNPQPLPQPQPQPSAPAPPQAGSVPAPEAPLPRPPGPDAESAPRGTKSAARREELPPAAAPVERPAQIPTGFDSEGFDAAVAGFASWSSAGSPQGPGRAAESLRPAPASFVPPVGLSNRLQVDYPSQAREVRAGVVPVRPVYGPQE